MGLLDEAIREHLELKRRHGADAAEIARLEQEALGPARRTPANAEPEAPAADEQELFQDEPPAVAEAPTTVHAPAVDDEYEYVYEGEEEFEEAAEAPSPEPIPTPQQQTVEFEPASEEEWADDWDEAGEEPEPNVPPVVPEGAKAEEEASAGDGDKSEDVLEETPEFLQETPEHDRLWFEQKPPRDFEF
jgi:hypothetical protein